MALRRTSAQLDRILARLPGKAQPCAECAAREAMTEDDFRARFAEWLAEHGGRLVPIEPEGESTAEG